MVESRLPWWLVLLLGVWVAALTLWSWPRAPREWRWGAGLLSLVYLGLLSLALGGDPRVATISATTVPHASAVNWSALLSAGAAGLAVVMLLGRPSSRGQLGWFLVLTAASSAHCFVIGVPSVGWTLLVAVGLLGLLFASEMLRGPQPTWAEWLPATNAVPPCSIGLTWGTGFALALLLIGTWRYAVRVETSRATASHRFSAIPSAEAVRSALNTSGERQSAGASPAVGFLSTGPFELAFGRRADVVVLLATLAFLMLAMPHSSQRRSALHRKDSSAHEGAA